MREGVRTDAHPGLAEPMKFSQVQHQESPAQYRVVAVFSIPLHRKSQLHPYSRQKCSPAIQVVLRKLRYKIPPRRTLFLLAYLRVQSDFEQLQRKAFRSCQEHQVQFLVPEHCGRWAERSASDKE